MRQQCVRLGLAVCFAVLFLFQSAAAQQNRQPAASPVEGKWAGKVATDAGEMEISVAIKMEQGKASGAIENPHGSWPITGASLKDGVWTVTFSVEGAADRWMKGAVKGDEFAGEWNNAPMAVGTFELKRVK